jgi:homoserine O-succinyltransferase
MTLLFDKHWPIESPALAPADDDLDRRDDHRPELTIGLINNMPDAALMSTERQLFDLLGAAAERLVVRLHFYTMEATPRSEWGRDYVRRYYRSTDDLVLGSLDGIIVTGAESRAACLTDEPYWTALTQVMDWARENTISSVYSCLAVHAAVLHMDGVERYKLPAKCIGVFTQTKTRDHPLMHYVPATFRIPHARWNEVQEEAIASCGYSVLTKSAEAGVARLNRVGGRGAYSIRHTGRIKRDPELRRKHDLPATSTNRARSCCLPWRKSRSCCRPGRSSRSRPSARRQRPSLFARCWARSTS